MEISARSTLDSRARDHRVIACRIGCHGNHHSVHPIDRALVVNEGLGTELGYRDEARSVQVFIGGLSTFVVGIQAESGRRGSCIRGGNLQRRSTDRNRSPTGNRAWTRSRAARAVTPLRLEDASRGLVLALRLWSSTTEFSGSPAGPRQPDRGPANADRPRRSGPEPCSRCQRAIGASTNRRRRARRQFEARTRSVRTCASSALPSVREVAGFVCK